MSRALGITAARASQWRDQFLAAGQAGLMCRVSPAGHRPAARAADLSGKRLTQWAEAGLARAAR